MQGQTPKSLPRVLPSKRTGEMCVYNTRPQVAPSRTSLQLLVIQYNSRDMFSGGQDVRGCQLKSCGLFDQFADCKQNANGGLTAVETPEPDNPNLAVIFLSSDLVLHDFQHLVGRVCAKTGTKRSVENLQLEAINVICGEAATLTDDCSKLE